MLEQTDPGCCPVTAQIPAVSWLAEATTAWVIGSSAWLSPPAMAAWDCLTRTAGLNPEVEVTMRLPMSTKGNVPGEAAAPGRTP